MKHLIILLLLSSICYSQEVPFRFTNQQSITSNALNEDFDDIYYRNSLLGQSLESLQNKVDSIPQWNQRSAINSSFIKTQNGYNGSGNDLQSVINAITGKLDSVSTSTCTTDSTKVLKSGDTMTGNLAMNGANITLTAGNTVDGRDISIDALHFTNYSNPHQTTLSQVITQGNSYSSMTIYGNGVSSITIGGDMTALHFYGDGTGLLGVSHLGDNLGNHIATTTLNMSGYNIVSIGSMTSVSGNISGKHYGDGYNLSNLDANKIINGLLGTNYGGTNNNSYSSNKAVYYDGTKLNTETLIPISQGGTGNPTYTNQALIKYDSGGNDFVSGLLETQISTSGHTHNLNDLNGVLSLAHGGTNQSSYGTSYGVLYLDNGTIFNTNSGLRFYNDFTSNNWIYNGLHLTGWNGTYNNSNRLIFDNGSQTYKEYEIYVATGTSSYTQPSLIINGYTGSTGFIGINVLNPQRTLELIDKSSLDSTAIRLDDYLNTSKYYDLLTGEDISGNFWLNINSTDNNPNISIAPEHIGINSLYGSDNLTVGGTASITSSLKVGGYNVLTTNSGTLYTNTSFGGAISGTYNATTYNQPISTVAVNSIGTPQVSSISDTKISGTGTLVTRLNAEQWNGNKLVSVYGYGIVCSGSVSQVNVDNISTGLTTVNNVIGCLQSCPNNNTDIFCIFTKGTNAGTISIYLCRTSGNFTAGTNYVNYIVFGY